MKMHPEHLIPGLSASGAGPAHTLRPSDRLLTLLALIERTVLPRRIELVGAEKVITLPVAAKRLQLGVHAQTHVVVDEALAKAAPPAYKLLRRRLRAIPRDHEILQTHETAICACAARALLTFIEEGAASYDIEAAPREDVVSAAAFPALMLYEQARDHAATAEGGAVRAFVNRVSAKMEEVWLFTQDGWVLEGPSARRTLEEYATMTQTARQLSAWTAATSGDGKPAIAYATRPPHDWIWCIAVDANHIALLRCAPLHWASTLSAWTYDALDETSSKPADML